MAIIAETGGRNRTKFLCFIKIKLLLTDDIKLVVVN